MCINRNRKGEEVYIKLKGSSQPAKKEITLIFEKEKQEFIFENINTYVIPSINRSFSAPIKLNAPYTFSDLEFLILYDTNLLISLKLINSF